MIDNRLSFKTHLTHIENKLDKVLMRIRKLNWLNRQMQIRVKIRIYHSVFIPTIIIYGHQIWFKFIKNKSTYIERLRMMQNKVLRLITGAYKTTNISKLYEITKTISIDQESTILGDLNINSNLNKLDHKIKSDIINNRHKFFNLDFDTLDINCKEAIWCLTETGPFKVHLFKLKLVNDLICRYCNYENETVYHILFNCPYFVH